MGKVRGDRLNNDQLSVIDSASAFGQPSPDLEFQLANGLAL